MNIEDTVYEKLCLDSICNNKQDCFEIDLSVVADENEWVGLSLIAKIPSEIAIKFSTVTDESMRLYEDQFYYDKTDLHITILEIITCDRKLILTDEDINKYIAVIDKLVTKSGSLIFEFKGIITTKSCVVAKGYSIDNTLNDLREKLRTEFKNQILLNTIDNRYVALAAHCTLVRFKNKFKISNEYLNWMEKINDYYLGKCTISELELRIGNWSLTKEKSVCINKFHLHK